MFRLDPAVEQPVTKGVSMHRLLARTISGTLLLVSLALLTGVVGPVTDEDGPHSQATSVAASGERTSELAPPAVATGSRPDLPSLRATVSNVALAWPALGGVLLGILGVALIHAGVSLSSPRGPLPHPHAA